MKLTYQMVKTLVCESMMQAVNNYRDNPTTGHFTELQRAMLVYQQIGQVPINQREELCKKLFSEVGVGHWDEAIVKAATGMTIEEVNTKYGK